jgi:hypothetical protein
MLKSLGFVVGGMFAGAVVVEIIRKKCPEKLDKLYSTAGDIFDGMKEGFKEGYQSITESVSPAEA